MAEQLLLDLPRRAARGRQDFLIADPNRLALAMIEDWPNWPDRKLILTGPKGAGKTHLLHVWAEASGAKVVVPEEIVPMLGQEFDQGMCVAVDDSDTVSGPKQEQALLNLHNLLREAEGFLLMAARAPVRDWNIALPDLLSRLQATTVTKLYDPDDQLFYGVLLKLFDDRQLVIDPAVVSFIAGRIERSFAAAGEFVDIVDRQALRERREITRPFVADLLKDL